MKALGGLLLFAAVSIAPAAEAPAPDDPALEARVSALAAELRCLVCQNQSLADSNAPLAVDLRNEIRTRMQKGEGEREIVGFMTDRYGDFVLYRPPLRASTVLLWLGPLLLMAGGLFLLYRRLRGGGTRAAPDLTPEERARAARLLDGTGEDGKA